MQPKLSKSIDEYLANDGWSSGHFLHHAKLLFTDSDISNIASIDVGRTVVYLVPKHDESKTVKLYVHRNGRSSNYLTICDKRGNELNTYEHTTEYDVIKFRLLELLK